MRLTCKYKQVKLQPVKYSLTGSYIVIHSSKNTCRMFIIKEGHLVSYTSVKRSSVYTGYERRLWIAAYTTALQFGQEAQKRKDIRNTKFKLYVKGPQKHAIAGFLDSGFVFTKVKEIKNPAFNGCFSKKSRRL